MNVNGSRIVFGVVGAAAGATLAYLLIDYLIFKQKEKADLAELEEMTVDELLEKYTGKVIDEDGHPKMRVFPNLLQYNRALIESRVENRNNYEISEQIVIYNTKTELFTTLDQEPFDTTPFQDLQRRVKWTFDHNLGPDDDVMYVIYGNKSLQIILVFNEDVVGLSGDYSSIISEEVEETNQNFQESGYEDYADEKEIRPKIKKKRVAGVETGMRNPKRVNRIRKEADEG